MAVLGSYKENRDIYIGYFEVCCGLGGILGPMIGSLLFLFGGVMFPFLIIGGSYLVLICMSYAAAMKGSKDTGEGINEQLIKTVSEFEQASKK